MAGGLKRLVSSVVNFNIFVVFVVSVENDQLFTKNTLVHNEIRLDRNPTMQLIMSSLLTGHFQVTKILTLKTRLIAKPFL